MYVLLYCVSIPLVSNVILSVTSQAIAGVGGVGVRQKIAVKIVGCTVELTGPRQLALHSTARPVVLTHAPPRTHTSINTQTNKPIHTHSLMRTRTKARSRTGGPYLLYLAYTQRSRCEY